MQGAAGPWADLAGQFIKGDRVYDLDVCYSDFPGPVRTIAVEQDGEIIFEENILSRRSASNESTGCDELSTTINSSLLAEGVHTYRILAWGTGDGGGGESEPWTVTIDRTAPTAPHDFLADFVEESGEGDIDWLTEDPALGDGSPGSGVASHEYLYQRPGASAVTGVAGEPGVRFPNAFIGELVHVEVTPVDGVGNRGPTTTINIAVASVGDCQVDPLAIDSITAALHVADTDAPVDAFTFDTPQTAAQVEAALPAGTSVVSMLERDPGTQVDSQTSAISPIATMSFRESMDFWNAIVSEDTDDFEDYLLSARATANATDQAVIDEQLDSLDERRLAIQTYGDVPIRAFAIPHDPAAAMSITNHFAGQLQLARTTTVAGETGEGCPAVDESGARGTEGDSEAELESELGPAGREALAEGDDGKVETNVRAGSYSPYRVRVATYDRVYRPDDGEDRQFHKVVAAWRFGASSNRYYWWRGYRRNDIRRGVEVQVETDLEDQGHGFGAPPWGFLPADDDGPDQAGIPAVWTASYSCAYPDDYLNDDVHHGYSLTVGMGCRPRANRFRYRWAHIVTALDANDTVRASVQPVHYGRDDDPTPVPGLSELEYCDANRGKLGSCFFGDHGVATVFFSRRSDGGTNLRTPGQALFER